VCAASAKNTGTEQTQQLQNTNAHVAEKHDVRP